MSYGGEGVARMRVLQVVVLIVFGVIAARLAYIQLKLLLFKVAN